ncbi:MAG: O-antigen ligase family protein, partial [Patescibacteria group bacterium]
MKRFYLIDERILIRVVQTLAGLTFLVPLITSSGFYFPFIVPRNVVFRVLVALMVFVYAVLVAQNRSFLPKRHIVWLLLLAFVASFTVASVFGNGFQWSFWSNFERMDGLITLYHLFAFLMIVYSTFRSRDYFHELLQVSFVIAIVVSLVGISQLVGVNLLLASSGGARISATLGNATYLAAYLLIHLFIGAFLLLNRREGVKDDVMRYALIAFDLTVTAFHVMFSAGDGRVGMWSQIFSHPFLWGYIVALHLAAFVPVIMRRMPDTVVVHDARGVPAPTRGIREFVGKLCDAFLYGLPLVVFIFLIGTTQTRGALVGLAMGIIAMSIMLLVRKGERRAVRIASCLIILSIIGSGALIISNRDNAFIQRVDILSKIASISRSDGTVQTRLVSWEAGLKGFLDRPLFGWGLEQYQVIFNKYFPVVIYTDEGTPLWFDRPHNLLVQYLAEGGVITVITYLAFLVVFVLLMIRHQKQKYTDVLFVGLIVAYLGQNLFVFDSINSYVPFYLMLAMMLHLLVREGDPHGAASPQGQQGALISSRGWAVVGITGVVMAALIWGGSVRAAQTNSAFVEKYSLLTTQTAPQEIRRTLDDIFTVIDAGPFLGRAELLGVVSEHVVSLLQRRTVSDTVMVSIVSDLDIRFNNLPRSIRSDARVDLFQMNMLLNAAYLDTKYATEVLTLGAEITPLSPTRPQIYYILGRALMILGRYDEGIETFQKAVALAPHIFDAQWNLFVAYLTLP